MARRVLARPLSVPALFVRAMISDGTLPEVNRLSLKERSSIGRAPVSKTGGWGFESLRSCCPGGTFAALPQVAKPSVR